MRTILIDLNDTSIKTIEVGQLYENENTILKIIIPTELEGLNKYYLSFKGKTVYNTDYLSVENINDTICVSYALPLALTNINRLSLQLIGQSAFIIGRSSVVDLILQNSIQDQNNNSETLPPSHDHTVTIATQLSELENDIGFITASDLPPEKNIPTQISDLIDDIGLAKSSNIPTKISELNNDTNFVSLSELLSYLQLISNIYVGPDDPSSNEQILIWIDTNAETEEENDDDNNCLIDKNNKKIQTVDGQWFCLQSKSTYIPLTTALNEIFYTNQNQLFNVCQ